MLQIFQQTLAEIEATTRGSKRTMLLANLMTQMESHYKISMNKERFEYETEPAVRELYLAVSAAREI